MSNAVFPTSIRGMAIEFARAPLFSTIVHADPSFIETRIAQAQNPRWQYELAYNYIKGDPSDLVQGYTYTDLDRLVAFFLYHKGQADSFLFEDTYTPDNYIGPAMLTTVPNVAAQLSLVQDSISSIWYSPIQKLHSGIWYEDIADLKGTMQVYANGILQTLNTSYHVYGPGLAIPGHSYSSMYLQWASQPTAPITIQTYFYRRVRFDEDQLAFEKFLQYVWGGGGHLGGNSIKLVTSRLRLA